MLDRFISTTVNITLASTLVAGYSIGQLVLPSSPDSTYAYYLSLQQRISGSTQEDTDTTQC